VEAWRRVLRRPCAGSAVEHAGGTEEQGSGGRSMLAVGPPRVLISGWTAHAVHSAGGAAERGSVSGA